MKLPCYRIRAMVQSGLIDHWIRKYSIQSVHGTGCLNTASGITRFKNVTLENIGAVFLLLIIGLSAGLLTFVVELLTHCLCEVFHYLCRRKYVY